MCMRAQSLMKLANKRGAEVGPEIVDEIEREAINVVSNTQLKVGHVGGCVLRHAFICAECVMQVSYLLCADACAHLPHMHFPS